MKTVFKQPRYLLLLVIFSLAFLVLSIWLPNLDFVKDTFFSSTLTFDQVYLLVNEDKVSLGTPLVSGAQVTATVLGQAKGPKIRVATYTAKSRHRRVRGHRQLLTRVKIKDIVSKDVKDKTGR